jgi:Domain of unknown function (DUF4360)
VLPGLFESAKGATMKKLLLVFSLFSSTAFAQATDPGVDRQRQFHDGGFGARGNENSERPGRDFQHGPGHFAGNGCPAGTMNVVFAPDNLSFTILYDNFVADTSKDPNGGRMSRMSCDSVIPVKLPVGQQMEITRVDYRGFVALPQGARASLRSTYNFLNPGGIGPGGRGAGPGGDWQNRDRINLSYDFSGPLSQDYLVSSGAMGNGRNLAATEVSPCGGDAQLDIRNDLTVFSPQGQEASATVDSVDGSGKAVYYVNWRSCQAGGGDQGGNSDQGNHGDQGFHGNRGPWGFSEAEAVPN